MNHIEKYYTKINHFINDLLCQFKAIIVQNRYKKNLKRIQIDIKSKKIRVLFYVTTNQKWGYQSLYELFEQDERFEPFVVVAMIDIAHTGMDKTRMNLEENYNFFKSKGMKVEYGYRNHEYISLSEFSPDIIFYEQPWGLRSPQKPKIQSEHSLTCYSTYGFNMLDFHNDYQQNFHKLLWKIFIDSNDTAKRYDSYWIGNSKNCVVTGYSKLDVYKTELSKDADRYWKDKNKTRIIYAPHHSFEEDGLHVATFKENGEYILEFAKSHPETTWIFKPHPRFKYALLINEIMTEEEIENYYSEWGKIGTIYTQGDYFDIFRTSDLMITDCCSFLAEYLPTLKPVIRLVNPKGLKPNTIGQKIINGYYEVTTNEELKDTYTSLVREKFDPKYNIRKSVVKELIDPNESSSQKIYNYILKVLGE